MNPVKITRALISVFYKDNLEPIIRTLAAQGVVMTISESLEAATNALIHTEMLAIGNPNRLVGGAGACAVDKDGNVVLPYNTEGMYRGWIRREGVFVAIHE